MLLHLLTGRLNGFVASVALAYVMQKTPYVFPIVGGRKVEQLQENLEALNIHLTEAHIKELDATAAFSPGYPFSIIVSLFVSGWSAVLISVQGDYGDPVRLFRMSAKVDPQPLLPAVKPVPKN